jgi:DedD protein
MTQKDPGTEFNPRHRIIGAVILVTAAVIFVPMVLSEREAPPLSASAPTVAPIEAQREDEVKIAVTDLRRPASDSSAPVPAPAAPAPAARTMEAAKPAAAALAPPPAKAAAASPAKAPEKVQPPKTAPKLDQGWVVQVGTFSNTTNAERLEAKLREEGHAVRTERVTLASGKAVRLQVGPFRDKALALKAQGQIQKEIGVQGVVLAYP